MSPASGPAGGSSDPFEMLEKFRRQRRGALLPVTCLHGDPREAQIGKNCSNSISFSTRLSSLPTNAIKNPLFRGYGNRHDPGAARRALPQRLFACQRAAAAERAGPTLKGLQTFFFPWQGR